MNKHVMFVEDDAVVRENYTELLSDEGFTVSSYADQSSALSSATSALPDLVLLDISLNDERDAGFHLCSELRRLSRKLPIVFFTSHDNESDKISGIRLGADDYLTKDVSIDFLVIRIEALMRRCAELAYPELSVDSESAGKRIAGPLTIDMDKLSVYWHNTKIELSLSQIRMTEALIEREGQVNSFSRLMAAANICVEPNTVTAHIRAIRNAFNVVDQDFDRIESVRGVGYRWLAD